MIYFAAILISQFSTEAHAEEPYKRVKPWRYEKYLGQIDEVIHNGPTELLLYNRYDGGVSSNTAISFTNEEGETREWLTVLSSAYDVFVVSEEFATFMGAEIKTTNKTLIPIWNEYKFGGEIKYATFDELIIGNMTLNDVIAFVGGDSDPGSDLKDSKVSIAIGMNLLESAYQIQPSEGIITIEGSPDGSALIAEYGDAITYRNFKGGTTKYGNEKSYLPSLNLITETLVNEQPQRLSIGSGQVGSCQARIGDVDTIDSNDDFNTTYTQLQFGSHTVESVCTNSQFFDQRLFPLDGIITSDVLMHFDIAVDPSNQQFALQAVNGPQKRLSFVPITLQQAQETIDEKMNESSNNEEEESTDPSASDWNALMQVQLDMGDLEAAYASATKMTEIEADKCERWLKASTIALKLDKIDEALSHAEKSAQLYRQWWDLDLDTRLTIEAEQDKMKPEDAEEAKAAQAELAEGEDTLWHHVQSGSCHEADAQAAWSHIAKGHVDSIEELYREKLDLDENLAFATAYAAFIRNDLTLAQESLRQAIILDPKSMQKAKSALSMWYADVGDWEQAKSLMKAAEAINITEPHEALTEAIEIDNYRNQEGSEATIELLEARLASLPSNIDTSYLYVRELKLAQAGGAYDDAVAAAEAVFNKSLDVIMTDQPMSRNQYRVVAQYVRFLILTDRIEKAGEIITERLEKQTFSHHYSALAYADFHAYNGDMDAAMEALQKLSLDGIDSQSIVHAMLFRSTASAE